MQFLKIWMVSYLQSIVSFKSFWLAKSEQLQSLIFDSYFPNYALNISLSDFGIIKDVAVEEPFQFHLLQKMICSLMLERVI